MDSSLSSKYFPISDDESIVGVQKDKFPARTPLRRVGGSHPHVWIGRTGLKAEMTHTRPDMITEIPAGDFSAIEGATDKGDSTEILKSELRATDDVVPLGRWGLKIGVANVGSEYIYAIECSIGKGDMDAIAGDDSGKGG